MGFIVFFFFFKQKTAYEMRISDWSSDVCSSDLGSTGALLIGVIQDWWVRLFFVIASSSSMCGSSPVTLSSGTPTNSWKPRPRQARTARPANSESAFTKPSSRQNRANRRRDRNTSPTPTRRADTTEEADEKRHHAGTRW